MTQSASLPLAGLLRGLAADPGRPRLTWYGEAGERTELSGHVLDNWVTKTTNLLVQEFGAGPGTMVLLDLPVHWRTVVWAFAAWRCGACVAVTADPPPGVAHDVLVTHRPEEAEHLAEGAGSADVVAVALPALARRFEGTLPPGAVDAASAVMTYGDVLTWIAEADTSRRALLTSQGRVSHAKLLAWARNVVGARNPLPGPAATPEGGHPAGAGEAGASEPPERVLLGPAEGEVLELLAAALTAYARDDSLVVCAPAVTAELAEDPARAERLTSGERVTARWR